MSYLTKTFWQMTAGFMVIVVAALGLLYLTQTYKDAPGPGDLPPDNYLAN